MKIIRLKDVPAEERDGYSIKRLFTEPLSNHPENVGFYETTVPKGSVCKQHYHAKLDEFILFLTKAKMRVEKEIYNFEPGDMVILKPQDKHEFVAEENEVKLIAMKLPNIVDDKVNC
jgi:quercetin dioxygenase-like cupin family protein